MVSVTDVDTLSTVALVLAILAFVVQLIVFIVQSADSSRVMRQSEALHGQMLSVLAQVQERASGTQRSVDTINTKLIEAIVGKANAEGFSVGEADVIEQLKSDEGVPVPDVPGTLSPPAKTEPTVSEVRRPRRMMAGLSFDWPPPLPTDVASELHQEMTTWPPLSDFEKNAAVLFDLQDEDLATMMRLATDLVNCTDGAGSIGPGIRSGLDPKLQEKGLVEKVPGFKLGTLSPLGREVGRLFTAAEPPPASFAKYVPLRRKAELHEAQLDARLSNRDDA